LKYSLKVDEASPSPSILEQEARSVLFSSCNARDSEGGAVGLGGSVVAEDGDSLVEDAGDLDGFLAGGSL
jgi:hypothetical protein